MPEIVSIADGDDPEALARLAWETWTDWIAERPLHLPEDDVPWEKLGASSRELCVRIGAAVAEAATAGLRSRLADADNAIGEVIRHAESWQERGGHPVNAAEILLQVLAPWTGGGQERSDGEPASPLAAELDPPQLPGQLPLPGTEPGHA